MVLRQMLKRNKKILFFFFYFALVHLILDGTVVSVWGKVVIHNALVLRPSIGSQLVENLLTWGVDVLNFPLIAPTVPAQGWFYKFLENLFGDWQFLCLPLNSSLWALAATVVWSRMRRPSAMVVSVGAGEKHGRLRQKHDVCFWRSITHSSALNEKEEGNKMRRIVGSPTPCKGYSRLQGVRSVHCRRQLLGC